MVSSQTIAVPAGALGRTARVGGRWRQRSLTIADLAGGLMVVTPMLLGAYFYTGAPVLELGMYGLLLLAVLPHTGPFFDSLGRHPINLVLVLLFAVLAMATAAVWVEAPSLAAWQQAQALGATAVWASIYIVMFSSCSTFGGLVRLMTWLRVACIAVTASVYLAALGHMVGLNFGEVLAFRDGHVRAFGPLGDQVGFIVVLPALISLASRRPLLFGASVGAIVLTGTRGAMLCLVIGVLVYTRQLLLKRPKGAGRPRALVWKALAPALALAAIVLMSPISNAFLNRLSAATFRPAAIDLGVQIVRANPVIGVGFNGFERARPAVAEDWLTPDQAANGLSRAANQYVQTATDGGAAALLLLLLFVLFCCRNAFRIMRDAEVPVQLFGAQLWLISVLVGNLGALWLLSNAATGFFIFAVAGLSARVSMVAKQQPGRGSPQSGRIFLLAG